jgi:hypothetical protein
MNRRFLGKESEKRQEKEGVAKKGRVSRSQAAREAVACLMSCKQFRIYGGIEYCGEHSRTLYEKMLKKK